MEKIPDSEKARYIMIGGFLGAGKSTTLLKLSQYFLDRGKKVAVVTNDQSVGLVDTELMKAHALEVGEIPCGCFCCNFNNLVEVMDRLEENETPDIYLAEPVGSCTDLVATVSYPLRQLHGDKYLIAPLSVVLDPYRAGSALGILPKKGFTESVLYIYIKQMEEADILILNKNDLLLKSERGKAYHEKLLAELEKRYPSKQIYSVSTRNNEGLHEWFAHLESEVISDGESMDIDYRLYAEGEAQLGWLNTAYNVKFSIPLDGNDILLNLANAMQRCLIEEGNEVAHLKMTLKGQGSEAEVAVVNIVNNEFSAEVSERIRRPVKQASIIVNLRAEGDAESFEKAVSYAFEELHRGLRHAEVSVSSQQKHMESFQPAAPRPAYRFDKEGLTKNPES